MPSQAFRSITGNLYAHNSPGTLAGGAWIPSTSGEADPRRARAVEVFFLPYISQVSKEIVSSRYVFQNRRMMTFQVGSNGPNEMEFEFEDNRGFNVKVAIVVPGFASDGLNQWWHAILDVSGTNWRGRVGRVGVGLGGASTTADAISAYAQGLTAVNPGFTRLHMLRVHLNQNVSIAFGQRLNASGTPTFQDGTFAGLVSEFRVWDAFPSDTGSGFSYENMRTQFVSATPEDGALHFPQLIHCFRLNEASGTSPGGYEDVGYKNARFDGTTAGISGAVALTVVDGEHPFSGNAIVTGTASRVGSYKVSNTTTGFARSGSYKVAFVVPTPISRLGDYHVRSTADISKSGDYDVLNSGQFVSKSGTYAPESVAFSLKFGSYGILAVPVADSVSASGTYAVTFSDSATKSGSYDIVVFGTAAADGSYRVVQQPFDNAVKLGTYAILVPAVTTFTTVSGDYIVSSTGSATMSGSYRIAGQSTTASIGRTGRYSIYNPEKAAELAIRKLAELRSRTR